MKKKLSILMFFIMTISIFSNDKKSIVIGLVYDGVLESNTYVEELIKKEIDDLVGGSYDISFPKDKQVVDSFNKNDINSKMKKLLADDEVDIIINTGILGSYISLEKESFSKPVFSPFIINDFWGEENKKTVSNIKNLNYISSDVDLLNGVDELKKIKDFDKLTVVISEEIIRVLPNINSLIDKKLNEKQINFEYLVINDSDKLDTIYDKLENSEAILFGPLYDIHEKKVSQIINHINQKRIPSLAFLDSTQVESGALAGYSFDKELKKRVRATAVNLSFYLDGQPMETLSVQIDTIQPELVINMNTVEKTGIWPSWDILSKSKLINFSSSDEDELSLNLKEVIDISLNSNPEVRKIENELDVTDLNIKKAKTNFKPDIDANISGSVIDEDRAESLFTQSEQTMSAGVTLTQVIFSEDANMNVDIQKEKRKLKEAELETKKLDIILETSEAYFNVLKAQAYLNIQKTNIELIKRNLEIAKNRKSVGISGNSDIYRLESELAQSVSNMIQSLLGVNLAKTNLKRIMNYNLKETLNIKDLDLNNSDFMTSDNRLLTYISDQNKVDILSDYMIRKLVENSPELMSIEYGINIQDRLSKNADRKRYLPTVALQANFTKTNIINEGAGSDSPEFPYISSISDSATQATFGNLLSAFGNPDEDNWTIGIGVSLPIYSGGEIETDKEIAQEEKENLELQREAAIKYFEQRAISYVLQIVTEYSKITNAEISAESANKALNLVKDAYSRGVVTITDLMSAQSATISAEQYKATVKYDLMLAVMRAERASGFFYITKTSDERKVFFNELNNFEKN